MMELTAWEQGLARYLMAFQPGLIIESLEEKRVIDSLLRVSAYMTRCRWGVRDVIRWSNVSLDRVSENARKQVQGSGEGAAPEPESMTLFDVVGEFVSAQLAGKPMPGILVLADISENIQTDPSVVRLLREATEMIERGGMRKSIIIVGRAFELPCELRASFTSLVFDIPTTQDIHTAFDGYLADLHKHERYAKIQPTEDTIRAFARACTGLTLGEANGLLSLAVTRFEDVDMRGVKMAQKKKAEVLLKDAALSLYEPEGGIEIVGGVENVKAWINQITPIVQDPKEARDFGLKIPAGVMFAGIPGSGKSLLAKALAAHWKLPLLNFDVGSAFGSLVGESEKNIRNMQKTAEACKPCIVFIDEIEKALGGDSLDGGTTSRVKQSLLTWLQEKSDEIFVAATANDLTRLEKMPELIRAGRFDKIFFVDLPDEASRVDIFKIHMTRARHEISAAHAQKVAKLTKGYSGAEIEAVVQEALRAAFSASPRLLNPTLKIWEAVIKNTKPLSVSMKESINRLRDWSKQGRAVPAARTLEDDLADEVRVTEDAATVAAVTGLPGIMGELGFDE